MQKKSLAYILLLSFATISRAEQFYNIKDLEVLNLQNNFEEFLLHVNDIRPSERGKHWKDMYQAMSIGLIDYKIKTKDFSRKSFTEIEKIGRSTPLIDDEYYQLKRSIYAKKYLEQCFKKLEEKSICENELNTFWYFSHIKDPDIALDLANILENNECKLSRWPFYQTAISSKASPIFCNKPEIQKSIFQKITQESFKENFDYNYKNLVDKFIPPKCFEKLIEPLRQTLISTITNGLDKEMALNILDAKHLLSPSEQDLYYVIFLLDGPVTGDKMNIAWKKVEALNDNYSRREKILGLIEKLDLVPDAIFKDPNSSRDKAIINLFAKSFPEFLEYYGKSCLEYINKKNETKSNISSTFKCHQFLKTAKNNTQWLSDSIQSQYSAIKK